MLIWQLLIVFGKHTGGRAGKIKSTRELKGADLGARHTERPATFKRTPTSL